MATGNNIRVGDADREATASQLREHYADGRLTLEELNERLDQAFAAKTRTELNAVMRDLPMTPRPMVQASAGSGSGSGGRSGSWRPHALLAPVLMLFWLGVAVVGAGFLFGFGDKPFIIVVVLAALAFLRRIFGRRRRASARGGRGRRGGRCGRRYF
jgi:Domain of unknown function (DUF1707)